MSNLAEGIIEDVFIPRGINTVTGKMRYQRAPLQVLSFQIADGALETFIMPVSLVDELDQAFGSDTPAESEEMARHDFGYFSTGFHVVDESELGDYVGNPNTWRGFHFFGNI